MKYVIIIATVLYLGNAIKTISNAKNKVIIASVLRSYEVGFKKVNNTISLTQHRCQGM